MKYTIFLLLATLPAWGQAGVSGNAGISGNATIQISPTAVIAPANFYVSTTGSNSNPGTWTQPFLTLDKARQAIAALPCSAPRLVYLRGGTYYNSSTTFGVETSTVTCPTTYANYPGELVTLSGGVNISGGWATVTTGTCATATSNGYTCYQKSISNSTPYFEQLFYNGTRRMRPRMGATATNLVGIYGHSTGATSGNQGFTYTTSDPVSAWTSCTTGTDCIVFAFNKWTAPIQRISNIVTATHTITTTCGSSCPPSGGAGNPYQANERYVIENVKELLQFGGQWYLDRSTNPWTLSYVANAGENPNTDTVVMQSNNAVLTATGLQYTTFSGLNFQVDNYVVPATGYISLQLDPNLTVAMVTCKDCVSVTFSGNTFSQATTVGMQIIGKSSNVIVTSNLFYDIGAYVIRVGYKSGVLPCAGGCTDSLVPNHITISQNWLAGGSRFFPSGSGIALGIANNVTIDHNDIGYMYDKGLEICMPSSHTCQDGTATDHDISITNNDIHNIGQGVLTDLAGFYASTETGTNNVFNNNRIHDVNGAVVQNPQEPDPGVHGIYLDDQTGRWTVTNNLVYRALANMIHMNAGPQVAGQSNLIQNNILVNYANVPTGTGGCVGAQQPLTTFLVFTYRNNICLQDTASHTLVNQGQGPPSTGSSSVQAFISNVYFLAGTPRFNIQGAGSNLSFTTWKSTYGEDTAGTISTNPGFRAPGNCGASTIPQPGVCDDFTFTNGTGPGFGFVNFTQAFGPSTAMTVPTVTPTFLESTLAPSSF